MDYHKFNLWPEWGWKVCAPQSPTIIRLATPFKGAEVKEVLYLHGLGFSFHPDRLGGRFVPPEMTLSALILSLRGDSLAAAAALVPGTAPGALSSSPGWGIQWLILMSPATPPYP